MALASRLRQITDNLGRDDRWLASRLRVNELRLVAILGGVPLDPDERTRIDAFIASEGG